MDLSTLKQWWTKFLAYFHFSNTAVCELSRNCGLEDYHNVDDAEVVPDDNIPVNCLLKCYRCGKYYYV